jgi:hypothetical protein
MERQADIPLEPPVVRRRDIVPAKEDRSYLGFIATALASALLGGFLFGTWIPLASTGTVGGADRVPWMIQAHGWVQLQGWAGMFVAGMAVRLIPRFAGRKPVPRTVTLPLLAVLAVPVALRIAGQPWAKGDAAGTVAVLIAVLTAAGTIGVSAVLTVTLAKGRKGREPWRYFAWAGTAWWAAWGVLALLNIPTGDPLPGLLGLQDNDALLWVVMLGPIGNFIWGVQSRSVPIFFGRKTPPLRWMFPLLVALNVGVALIALSLAAGERGYQWAGAGFVFAGAALAVLPPFAGSVYGQAKRLRPRARFAARFIIAGNIAAVAAGALLVVAGSDMLLTGERGAAWAAFDTRDAARHLFGVGTISMLILGMARLIAPVFALERTESGVPQLLERLPFWLLVAAVVLRAGVPLLGDSIDRDAGQHTIAAAGIMGWLAIAIFASSVARAVLAEPRTKRALEEVAARSRSG